jgi:hypothetical protein
VTKPTLTGHARNGHAANGRAGGRGKSRMKGFLGGPAKRRRAPPPVPSAPPLSTVANGQTVPDPTRTPEPAPAAAPAAADRGEGGRFVHGNRAAAGRANAFSRKLGALRQAFVDAAASPDQIAEVGRKLQRLAGRGDVQAAALYLSYAIGRPQKAVDPDTLDLEEVALWLKSPGYQELLQLMGNRFAAALLAEVAAGTAPKDYAGLEAWLHKRGGQLAGAEATGERPPFADVCGFKPDPNPWRKRR